MTDVYRRELMSFGIDVIAIEPGPIKTPFGARAGAPWTVFNSRYGTMLRNADKIIDNAEKKSGLPVERVCAAVEHALERPKPSTRYLIHQKSGCFVLFPAGFCPTDGPICWCGTMKGGNRHRAV